MLLIGEMHTNCPDGRLLMCSSGRRGPSKPASPPGVRPSPPALPGAQRAREPRTRDIDLERAGGGGSHPVPPVRQLARSPFCLPPPPIPWASRLPDSPRAGGQAEPCGGWSRCPRAFSRAEAACSRPNVCTHINIVFAQMTFRSLSLWPPALPPSFHHQQIKISREDYRKRFQARADLYSGGFVMILMMMMVKWTV